MTITLPGVAKSHVTQADAGRVLGINSRVRVRHLIKIGELRENPALPKNFQARITVASVLAFKAKMEAGQQAL